MKEMPASDRHWDNLRSTLTELINFVRKLVGRFKISRNLSVDCQRKYPNFLPMELPFIDVDYIIFVILWSCTSEANAEKL